jgi:hypothetical protein
MHTPKEQARIPMRSVGTRREQVMSSLLVIAL